MSLAVRSRLAGSRSTPSRSSTGRGYGARGAGSQSTGRAGTDGSSSPDRTEPTIALPNRSASAARPPVCTARAKVDGAKATYRALLARGLETGEAANLTAFMHGLPSDGFQWTMPEVEAILRRRLEHAADVRAAEPRHPATASVRRVRSTIHDRRQGATGSTHVIDSPKP